MRLKKLIRQTFEVGNTCVDGLRGCGKDMLMANVIERRRKPYIANIDYHCPSSLHIPLNFNLLDCNNSFKDIIDGTIKFYDYPYPEGCDIYITDCGIIFPSQENGYLDKHYDYVSTFSALSRHLGSGANVHYNVQNLSRVWVKLREQAGIYIKCRYCYVLSNTFLGKIPLIKRLVKNVVIQGITIYDKYESCQNRVKPFKRVSPPLFASREKQAVYTEQNLERKARYDEQYGSVKNRLLIYRNKSDYDTRYYKALFKGGIKV